MIWTCVSRTGQPVAPDGCSRTVDWCREAGERWTVGLLSGAGRCASCGRTAWWDCCGGGKWDEHSSSTVLVRVHLPAQCVCVCAPAAGFCVVVIDLQSWTGRRWRCELVLRLPGPAPTADTRWERVEAAAGLAAHLGRCPFRPALLTAAAAAGWERGGGLKQAAGQGGGEPAAAGMAAVLAELRAGIEHMSWWGGRAAGVGITPTVLRAGMVPAKSTAI